MVKTLTMTLTDGIKFWVDDITTQRNCWFAMKSFSTIIVRIDLYTERDNKRQKEFESYFSCLLILVTALSVISQLCDTDERASDSVIRRRDSPCAIIKIYDLIILDYIK